MKKSCFACPCLMGGLHNNACQNWQLRLVGVDPNELLLGGWRTLQIVGLRTSLCKDIACVYNLPQNIATVKVKTNKFHYFTFEQKNFGNMHKKER